MLLPPLWNVFAGFLEKPIIWRKQHVRMCNARTCIFLCSSGKGNRNKARQLPSWGWTRILALMFTQAAGAQHLNWKNLSHHKLPETSKGRSAAVPWHDKLKPNGTYRTDCHDKFQGLSGDEVLPCHIHDLRNKTESFTKLFCNNSLHKWGTEIKEPDSSVWRCIVITTRTWANVCWDTDRGNNNLQDIHRLETQ